MLDPGDSFELLAALGERDEEDVAADVGAEDGQDVFSVDFTEAAGLNAGGAIDAEVGVADEELAGDVGSGGEGAEDGGCTDAEEDAADGAAGSPPSS